MLPFDWGNTGLLYRTDIVPADKISLEILADPSMAGKVSLPDGVDDAYALAAIATGAKNWASMTDEEFQKASDFLRRVHPNVRFYWTDLGQLDAAIKAGEIEAAWAWNASEVALKGEGVPVQFVRDPKVGVASWACGYVNLKGGQGNDDEVYDFLNALADPQSGKYLIEAWGYAHANRKSYEIANQDDLRKYGYEDVESFLAQSRFQVSISPELSAKMQHEFERIKAGF